MSYVPVSGSAITRRAVLRGMAGAALAYTVGRAWGAEPPPIKVQPLGEGLHVLSGAGGNILALSGADGLLMVDSGLADLASGVQAALGQMSPDAPRWLINTHFHFDHTGGNERVGARGAQIVASVNTQKRLSTDQFNEFLKRPSPAVPVVARPKVVFTQAMTLFHGGEEIQLSQVAPAHTDGDTRVLLTKANVLHLGDLFFNGFYPFIDYSSGGWLGGMAEQARAALAMVDDKTRIVPGHGPLGTKQDLTAYAQMLETVAERFTQAKQAGDAVEAVLAKGLTKEYDAQWGGGFMKPEAFVRCAYTSLLKHG